MRVDDDVAADVERVAAVRVDAPEVERPARLGVHADALAAHALDRLVGELVDADLPRVASDEPPERPVERGVRLVEARLLAPQLVVRLSHAAPL